MKRIVQSPFYSQNSLSREKPRTRQELVDQSKGWHKDHHTSEEIIEYNRYLDDMLKELDEPYWNQLQIIRSSERAKQEKYKHMMEEYRIKQTETEKEKQKKLEEEQKTKDAEYHRKFLKQLAPFLNKHAEKPNCSDLLLSYIQDTAKINIIRDQPKMVITDNSITFTCTHGGCSFFDDGGSYSESKEFSLWYVENTQSLEIDNDRIVNPVLYDMKEYNHTIHDSFYCEKPFGLSGIYGIRFDYEYTSEASWHYDS